MNDECDKKSYYIEGPKDAEGIPICVDDMVAINNDAEQYRVLSIIYSADGWMIETTKDPTNLYPPRNIHHAIEYLLAKTFVGVLDAADEYFRNNSISC